MSDEKPLLRVLRGETVWPPPIWLMRQAGRYLPEYRAVRASVPDFMSLCTTPALAAEVTLQPIRRFGFDAAILFSDILILPWALGQGLRFVEGEGPVLPPVRDAAALALLDRARLTNVVAPVMETVARARAALDGRTALIGFAGGPFTVACYMIEGRSSRDFPTVRALAYGKPAFFSALMELLIDTTIDYLSQQITAGADVVMLFDSWAGILSSSLFKMYVLQPTHQIVTALRERHPSTPIIGFPRLAGTMLGSYAGAGVNAVAIDTSIDPIFAARTVPADVAIQGNLDPMALVAGGQAMRNDTDQILTAMRNRPFVFNLGHGIVPETPLEHVATLVQQVRATR